LEDQEPLGCRDEHLARRGDAVGEVGGGIWSQHQSRQVTVLYRADDERIEDQLDRASQRAPRAVAEWSDAVAESRPARSDRSHARDQPRRGGRWGPRRRHWRAHGPPPYRHDHRRYPTRLARDGRSRSRIGAVFWTGRNRITVTRCQLGRPTEILVHRKYS